VAIAALPETDPSIIAKGAKDAQDPKAVKTARCSSSLPYPRSSVGLRRRLHAAWQRALQAIPPAGHPLILVAGLYLITQLAGEGVVLSTVSLLLQQRFGLRVALGGLVLGVASASGLLLGLRSLLASAVGPLAGHLSDAHPGRRSERPRSVRRFGRWPVVVASLVLGVAGFGLLFRATTLWAIVLGIVLSAVSGGAGLATLAALVGDLAPPGREGTVMGAYAAAGDVGSMAGPFLAFALASAVGLQWVYLLCALAFLAGLGLIWRYRRAQPAIDRAGEPGYTI
jgi:MFS family permease